MTALPPLPLPPGITQRYVDLTAEPTCGLKIHILEAGDPSRPLLLLFHGYPELAYTWRKMLLPLAFPSLSSSSGGLGHLALEGTDEDGGGGRGYHVVAPDSRGYGRTTGWDTSSYAQTNLGQFTSGQLLLDNIALLRALGHEEAACVVGHDFGATAASVCTLARPDLFRRGVFLGHVPTGGGPLPPLAGNKNKNFKTKEEEERMMPRDPDVHTSLARRAVPLKHYQWYNSTATAAHDWAHPPQGLKAFLRGYLHLKSHVWRRGARGGGGNERAGRLKGWTADELARMPGYYLMPLASTMPEVVARDMQGEDMSLTAARGTCITSEDELDVYVGEFTRTGFQGMLNWYRSATATDSGRSNTHNIHGGAVWAGKKYEVPIVYMSGAADWGNYQRPGALEALERGEVATQYRGTRILEGAGHWPQVEIPEAICREILQFVEEN